MQQSGLILESRCSISMLMRIPDHKKEKQKRYEIHVLLKFGHWEIYRDVGLPWVLFWPMWSVWTADLNSVGPIVFICQVVLAILWNFLFQNLLFLHLERFHVTFLLTLSISLSPIQDSNPRSRTNNGSHISAINAGN